MLLHELFLVDEWRTGVGTLTALLRVRRPHPIFDGHFPGRPVLPGVCLVQLVQELAASVAGGEVRLIRADQVKFIRMIDPSVDGSIRMTVTGKEGPAGEWQIVAEMVDAEMTDAEMTDAGSVCFRFKGIFQAGSNYVG
jgi:3-hydroxyacyl-[acyl-carrier-protein] dehydratase